MEHMLQKHMEKQILPTGNCRRIMSMTHNNYLKHHNFTSESFKSNNLIMLQIGQVKEINKF